HLLRHSKAGIGIDPGKARDRSQQGAAEVGARALEPGERGRVVEDGRGIVDRRHTGPCHAQHGGALLVDPLTRGPRLVPPAEPEQGRDAEQKPSARSHGSYLLPPGITHEAAAPEACSAYSRSMIRA